MSAQRHFLPSNPTRKQRDRVGTTSLKDAEEAVQKTLDTIAESRRILRQADEVLAKDRARHRPRND